MKVESDGGAIGKSSAGPDSLLKMNPTALLLI